MPLLTVRSHCKFATLEKAKAHLKVLAKSTRIIDMGTGFNEVLGHHSWFEMIDWKDNKMEMNDE